MKAEWKEQLGVWGSQLGCFLVDSAVMAAAYLTAFLLRFDFHEPWWGWRRVAFSFVTVWAAQGLALVMFGCYRLLWRYMSVGDVPKFVGAIGYSTAVLVLLRLGFPAQMGLRPPYSVTFFNGFLVTGGLSGVRLLWRFMVDGEYAWETVTSKRARRVLLVGAGSAGNMAARELRRQGAKQLMVVGFLDDDPA